MVADVFPRRVGVCLCPMPGMPEWHEPDVWTPMGLWDPVCHREPAGQRLVCHSMLVVLGGTHHLRDLRGEMLARRRKSASRKGKTRSYVAAG